MPTRAFSDRQGQRWKVWETIPQDARGCLPAYAKGWLTFEHEGTGERRRLAPIPDAWMTADDERLQLLSRVAEPARPNARTTPSAGMPVVRDAGDEMAATSREASGLGRDA